jgi:hypothetical protein
MNGTGLLAPAFARRLLQLPTGAWLTNSFADRRHA